MSDSVRPHRQQATRLLCPWILQARILEWAAMPSSRESSRPLDPTQVSWVSCIAGGSFMDEPPGKPICSSLFPSWLFHWYLTLLEGPRASLLGWCIGFLVNAVAHIVLVLISFSANGLISEFVSYCCCSKLPQMSCFKTIQIYFQSSRGQKSQIKALAGLCSF